MSRAKGTDKKKREKGNERHKCSMHQEKRRQEKLTLTLNESCEDLERMKALRKEICWMFEMSSCHFKKTQFW